MTASKTWIYIFTCKLCKTQWRHEYAHKPDQQQRQQLFNNYICEGCK